MTQAGASALVATTNGSGRIDIHAIKGPVHIAAGWVWLWSVLGALACLALLIAAWRYWRRRKAPDQTAAAPEPALPPEVRARTKLEEALAHLHDARLFCILVSDAVRVYLEERFELHAPERTTEEFLEEVQTSSFLTIEQKAALGGFLLRCDLAKFALYPHGPAELRAMHDSALRLIEETAARPASEPERISVA